MKPYKYIKITHNSKDWYWWLNKLDIPSYWVMKPEMHKYLLIVKQKNSDHSEDIIQAITLNNKDQLLLLRRSLMDREDYNSFYDYVRNEYKPVSNKSPELKNLTKVS